MTSGRTLDRSLVVLVVLGMPVLTWLALVEAPSFAGRSGFTAPLSWKLFFFHVPIALVSFLAFAVALVASILYLRRPDPTFDRSAHAAIEVGVLFTLLTLLTGMVWGEAEWGEPWRWNDVKLVLVLLLFLIYVAYLVLRQQIPEASARARIGALYAIAGFASVPLAWFAQRIWLSFHPTVFGVEGTGAGVDTPGVMPIFGLAMVLFAALFVYLYRWRENLLAVEERIDELSLATEVDA